MGFKDAITTMENAAAIVEEMEKEIEYLSWFKQNANFGPADSDIHSLMNTEYEEKTGNKVPKIWRQE